MRATPFFLGLCDADTPEQLAGFAARLGGAPARAQARDRRSGRRHPERRRRAAALVHGRGHDRAAAARPARPSRPGSARAARCSTRSGPASSTASRSINVCTLDGIARELFTYEGSGTLFTREDYCKVERLSLDDFHEVEKVLERGQREGYLKARTPAEIAPILFSGYGATIGQHHLAGVCSLQTERYEAERAGEIVGLYTITRFKGEGVGVKLIACMKTVGPRARARATSSRARPRSASGSSSSARASGRSRRTRRRPAKWIGYDESRAARARGATASTAGIAGAR